MLARIRPAAPRAAGFATAVAIALVVAHTRAECPPYWHSALPFQGADNNINAATTWDPDGPGPLGRQLVIGGAFDVAGDVVSRGVAAFDGSRWHALRGGNTVYEAWALHVHDGELYVGGVIDDGLGYSRSVAVWRDNQWQLVGDGIPGAAFALTTYAGELVAGGWMADIAGSGARNLARWTGSEWQPVGGGAGEDFDEQVYALATYGGDLYVGGELYRVGGVSRRGLARWDGAEWHTVGESVNDYVLCLTEYDGRLIVGGAFNFVGGGTLNVGRIAAWDGAAWSALGNGVGRRDSSGGFGVPWSMITHSGQLFVGGTFQEFDSGHGRRIASWNGSTWDALDSGCDNSVNALAAFEGRVVAGGDFWSAGTARVRRLAAWNGDAWTAVGDARRASVFEMTVHDGVPHAIGEFVDAAGVVHNGAAFWNGEQWQPLAGQFLFATGGGASLSAITSHNGELFVGGFFARIDSQPISNIARWNGIAWQPLGAGTNSTVTALLSHPSGLIVGGNFTAAGGEYRPRVARWNADVWQSMTNELDGFNNLVDVLAIHNGAIIAGGNFAGFAQGQPLNRIARWDGTHWRPLGTGITGDPFGTDVYAAASIGGDLFVGGRFGTAGGVSVQNFARWDGAAWHSSESPDSWVQSMAVQGGELVMGGVFTAIDGQPINRLARLTETGWDTIGGGVNDEVRTLLVHEDQLLVAGNFSIAGDRAVGGFAVFGTPPRCDGDVNCDRRVELTDLATLLVHFGTPSEATRAMGDLDADGDVDLDDLATLLSAFGLSCA